MCGPWDAPLELQCTLLDEDGPPPVEAVTPPKIEMRSGGDSDEAFRYGCAYAAQVIVFDECWRSLVEALKSADGGDSWLVMLIGARGFPLGEHRRIGGVDSRLYSEQLHVPWLIRFPDARGQLARSGALTSHLDVMPTLVEWINGDANKASPTFDGLSAVTLATVSSPPWREELLSASSEGSFAFRTSSWCLRGDTDRESESNGAELYVRPDDRWEANDVAKLCRDVVEELQTAAGATLQRFVFNKPLSSSAPATAVDVGRT
jgi:arylsulfatase A-like enzyme